MSMPSAATRRLLSLAVLVIFALPLGCMGLQLGHPDAGLVQEGEVNLQPGQEVEVYFARPYAGVPELVTVWSERCEVKDVNGYRFRVRNNGSAARKLAWKATGTAAPLTPGQRSERMIQGQPVQPPPTASEAQDSPAPPVSLGEPR